MYFRGLRILPTQTYLLSTTTTGVIMNFVYPLRADLEFGINMDHVISVRKEYENKDGMIWFFTVEGTRLFWRYPNNQKGCDADYDLLLEFISSKSDGTYLMQ
jgi:hypothetical protein